MAIIDTTLREGEQTAGVVFNLEAKKQIINSLVQIGVEEIELGVASQANQDLVALARFIRSRHPGQAFSLWCRCHDEDIDYAASLKPDTLALCMPSSDLHLSKKLGKDRQWAKKALNQALKRAKQAGISTVAVGLEDASRADTDFIRILADIAVKRGAFRLRLADTVGIATPTTMVKMIQPLVGSGIEIGVHCHNDFGMATANTITALEHGARWADATILGLGERAGNSRLEEVVSFLALKGDKSYNLEGLPSLSAFVAEHSGRTITPARPIIGKEIFACETGLHLQGLMNDPATYEPFAPEKLGLTRKLTIGRKAGKRSVALTLKRLGLNHCDESGLAKLTKQIRDMAANHKRSLTDYEITNLAKPFCPSI